MAAEPKSFLETFDEIQDIQDRVHYILKTADKLSEVGMDKIARILRYDAEGIQKSAEALQQAIHQRIHSDFRQAQQSSVTVLNAVLAGMEVAERAQKKAP